MELKHLGANIGLLHKCYRLLRLTVEAWLSDKALRLGAALAFYTSLSLAPLVLVTVAVLGFFFGEQAAKSEVFLQIEQVVGAEPANFMKGVVKNAARPASGLLATTLGVLALLAGATGVFVQLQDALNTIWEVSERKHSGLKRILIDRIKSFALILAIGLLLLISLTLSAGLEAASNFAQERFVLLLPFFKLLNIVVSWGVITFLFAAIFKILPDEHIEWKDVIVGAGITSVLFSVGKLLLGYYFARVAVGSLYGAAGSLVILLLWLYYASQILFLGAEFTKIYAREHGSKSQRSSAT
jgi:membrane protein